MKKLILSTVAAVAAVAAQGQGVVSLASGGAGSCIVSNSVTGATSKITAGGYTFGLYVASTLGGLSSATPVATFNNAGFAGIISGVSSFTVQSLSAGTTYFDEVKAWSNDGASSYEAFIANPGANTAGISAAGVGAVGTITPVAVGSTSPAPNVFTSSSSIPVLITPVPEPSTIALAGLGVAGLVAFRRRK